MNWMLIAMILIASFAIHSAWQTRTILSWPSSLPGLLLLGAGLYAVAFGIVNLGLARYSTFGQIIPDPSDAEAARWFTLWSVLGGIAAVISLVLFAIWHFLLGKQLPIRSLIGVSALYVGVVMMILALTSTFPSLNWM